MAGDDLGARVLTVEHGLDALTRRVTDRLDDGAERFAIQRRQIEQIEAGLKPKPADKWKLAGIVLTVAVLLFTWVWQAARYPDRSEYTAVTNKVDGIVAVMRARLDVLRETQLRSETDVALLQNQIATLEATLARLEKEIRRGRGE